jgi:hypothetical protein
MTSEAIFFSMCGLGAVVGILLGWESRSRLVAYRQIVENLSNEMANKISINEILTRTKSVLDAMKASLMEINSLMESHDSDLSLRIMCAQSQLAVQKQFLLGLDADIREKIELLPEEDRIIALELDKLKGTFEEAEAKLSNQLLALAPRDSLPN